jgi:hypothetical protein
MSIYRRFHALSIFLWIAGVYSRQVNVHVTAPWAREPYYILSEVSEFIYEYSSEAYWSYLDGLCEQSVVIDTLVRSDAHDQSDELENLVFSIASTLLPTQMQSLMEASVNLGVYAPSSEYLKSLHGMNNHACGNQSYVVVGLNNEILCPDIADIPIIEGNSPRFDDFVYPSSQGKAHAYLYGIPGTSSFCSLHRKLYPLARNAQIGYVVRYIFPSMTSSPAPSTRLQGYGVFLDIKNMEYKTIDDSKSSSADDSSTSFSFPDEDVQGINFLTISNRRADLQPSLRKLYDQLLVAGESVDEPMKVWKMKNIGLQTVYAMNELRNKLAMDESMSQDVRSIEPVYQLTEYVHNFPSHASKLSSIKMNAAFREAMSAWHDYGLTAALPANTLFVNGIPISLGAATFNLYDLIVLIRQEIESVSQLSSLPLPASVGKAILEAAMASSASSTSAEKKLVRIDVSKGAKYVVNFINNLERDSQYKRWSKKLQQLLYPSWSLIPLARNLYTVIAVVNVLSMEGANMMIQLQMLHQQMMPVRLGYVLSCEADVQTSTSSLSPADICRIYLYVKETSGSLEKATNFLIAVAADVQEQLNPSSGYEDPYAEPSAATAMVESASLTLTEAEIASMAYLQLHERHPKPSELSTLLQALHEYNASEFAQNCTAYISTHGLEDNSFSMNGLYLRHQSALGGLGQQLMQLLGREQYLLQQLVMGGSLPESTSSIFNAILSVSTTYPRHHPILDESTPIRYLDSSSYEVKALMREFSEEGLYLKQTASKTSGDALTETIWLSAPLSAGGLISAANMLDWLIAKDDRSLRVAFVWHLDLPSSLSNNDTTATSAAISIDGQAEGEDPIDNTNNNAKEEEELQLVSFIESATRKVIAKHDPGAYQLLAKVITSAFISS